MTRLSELAQLIEQDSLPAWVKTAIEKNREEIERVLSEGGVYTLTGPAGEEIKIEKKKGAGIAA